MKNFLRLIGIIIGALWCQGVVGVTINNVDYTLTNPGAFQTKYATITGSSNFTNSDFIINASVQYKNTGDWLTLTYNIIGITSIATSQNNYIKTVTIGINVGTTVNGTKGTINASAFANCPMLHSFSVASDNKFYSANNGVLFDNTGTSLLFYPVAKKENIYEIPDIVTSIATSAKLSSNVTTLIFKGSSVPELTHDNFIASATTIFVPSALLTSFKTHAEWKKIQNIIAFDLNVENGQTLFSCSEPGYLSNFLSSQQSTLSNLKITGPLNGTDIKFLRTLTTTNLSTLDLTDATIVTGGGAYYESYETEKNIFPKYAFTNCQTLVTVSLPKTVIKIGEGAFKDASNVTTLTVTGCTFTEIEANAFSNVAKVTKFDLPNTVIIIDPTAFFETSANTAFSISNSNYQSNNGVIYANKGDELFLYPIASPNKTLTVTKNITAINAESGLTLASNLNEIKVEEDNNFFSANNGVLYNNDFTTLLAYPLAKAEAEYEIPSTVNRIESSVALSKDITSITYKGGKAPNVVNTDLLFSKIDKAKCTLYVSKAAYDSFKNAKPWSTLADIIRYDVTPEDLATKITVTTAGDLSNQLQGKQFTTTHLIIEGPLNGTDINYLREMAGSNASASSTGKGMLQYLDLKNAHIVSGGNGYLNSGVGETGNQSDMGGTHTTSNNIFPYYAFFKCPTLQTIILPTSVTTIGNSSFRDCVNLTKVDMTDCKFDSIGHNAFRSSKNIEAFLLPESLETIANDAFVETTGNKEFKLQYTSDWFEVLEGVLFSKDKKDLVAFPAGKEIAEYTVPFGTAKIVSCSFSASKLKSLSMPYGLINLEPWAFEGTNFTSLTLPATVTTIGRGAFLGCGSVKHLYIQNPTPPTVTTVDGQQLNKDSCTLHVPYQKKDTYKDANYWGEFKNIEELSDVIFVYTAGTLQSSLQSMSINAKELSSIMVQGVLNSSDIKYLRKLAGGDSIGQPILNTKLKSINLGQAIIQEGGDPYLTLNGTPYTTSANNFGKYAFANTGLEAFHFPANITTVETNMFKNCQDLNYIVFETLPSGMAINDAKSLLNESQPNGIIAINSYNDGTNENVPNVVFANDKNATVELTDKYNYVSHVKLSLESCTFTKYFSKETKDGDCRGWETIILPFKPTEIRGFNRRGKEAYLVPFNEGEKDEVEFGGTELLVLNFWLRKLTKDGFVDVTFHEIEPNTPYIISMPNSPMDYNNTYNIRGNVKFIANASEEESSILLNETTELTTMTGSTFDMSATYKNRTDLTNAYVLNAAGTSFDLISTITERKDTVNAFEAYAIVHSAYQGVKSLSINQANIPSGLREIMMNGAQGEEKEFIAMGVANGIRIVSTVDKVIRIHSIEGRMIANEYIYEGENFISLPKGIYLIDRQKIVVY